MKLYWEGAARGWSSGPLPAIRRLPAAPRSTAAPIAFKLQWGARPVQLYWHRWERTAAQVVRPESEGKLMRFATAVWRRLPLAVAVNALGAARESCASPRPVRNMKRALRSLVEGTVAPLAPFVWRAQPAPRLLILMYHRVLPREHPDRASEQPGMYVSPETLATHIRLLRRYFEIVHLDEWVQGAAKWAATPEARLCADVR